VPTFKIIVNGDDDKKMAMIRLKNSLSLRCIGARKRFIAPIWCGKWRAETKTA
jgi:hypothetical protein